MINPVREIKLYAKIFNNSGQAYLFKSVKESLQNIVSNQLILTATLFGTNDLKNLEYLSKCFVYRKQNFDKKSSKASQLSQLSTKTDLRLIREKRD